jgi:hypothetical protein
MSKVLARRGNLGMQIAFMRDNEWGARGSSFGLVVWPMMGREVSQTSHLDLEYPCQSDKESCSLKLRTNQCGLGMGILRSSTWGNSVFRNWCCR